MSPFPSWMRNALFATAAMNILAAGAFLPAAEALRALAGFPEGPPFYLMTVAMFVLSFGLAYFWAAVQGRAENLFLALAAGGKLSFFALTVTFWANGSLPWQAPLLGSADLGFGLIFLAWLFGARARPTRG